MYSGQVINDLMAMVARAEERAQEIKAAAEATPEPFGYYVPNYVYDRRNQQLQGVA